jgi:hypothetical protein
MRLLFIKSHYLHTSLLPKESFGAVEKGVSVVLFVVSRKGY